MDYSRPIPQNATAEERILAAATNEFGRKGFYGARTQAIADAAGVNKAMLHYYFRSKDNLYARVIRRAIGQVRGRVWSTWQTDEPVETRVERMVDAFLDGYNQNRGFLIIVLREVTDGGTRLSKILNELRSEFSLEGTINPLKRLDQIGAEMGLNGDQTLHYLINIVGMCLISFISPILLEGVLEYGIPDFEAFLNNRRQAIKVTIRAAVRALEENHKRGEP